MEKEEEQEVMEHFYLQHMMKMKIHLPSICKVGTGFSDEDLDQLYQILKPKVTIKKNPRIIVRWKQMYGLNQN